MRREREAGRVPARGKEGSPRERAVTRRRVQVRPAKEEQGSGAVRFQVEKKGLVGERSVIVALMERRAVRSLGCRFCGRDGRIRRIRS